MPHRVAGIAIVLALFAAPAWPCSLPVGRSIPTPSALVHDAEVIVLVRAESSSDAPDREGARLGPKTQVRFAVLKVFKGQLPGGELTFVGELVDRNDPNDRPVPYDFVRPGGRSGNCFAYGYRRNAEYLLLLHKTDYAPRLALTPYWSPLAPTNEQVPGGLDDPWVVWVSRQLTEKGR